MARLVDELSTAEAAVSVAEVARVRVLAAAGRFALDAVAERRASSRESDMAMREVASELAAACRVSDRTMQRDIGEVMTLIESYPRTVRAWEAAAISRRHVRVIMDAGAELPTEQRDAFDRIAEERAREVSSPGRLRSQLSVAAQRLHPRTLTERHRAGRELRCVRVVPGGDGMSDLIATLPTVLAAAIHDRLTQQARVIVDARRDAAAASGAAGGGATGCGATWGEVTGGEATSPGGPVAGAGRRDSDPVEGAVPPAVDSRTMDHIRADVFADMLLTGDPSVDPTRPGDGPGTLGKIRAKLQVAVPALTMLTPSEENIAPADLIGRGPIDAATARALAESTSLPWDRVITHPITGAVLHTDTYVRTAAIDRHVRARDRRCRWPGCTAPAIRCEIDHTVDWALGGKTDVRNLACLCQRHHTQKQFTRWGVRHLEGGLLEWTSPTGRVYTAGVDPYPAGTDSPGVRFDEDAPPWESREPGSASAAN